GGHEDDLSDRFARLLLRLPAGGAVAAEDGSLDHRAGLLVERERQGVVEQPRKRPADIPEAPNDGGGGGADRICVHVRALAYAGHYDSTGARSPVGMQDDRLAEFTPQLAVVRELPEPAAELRVVRAGRRVVLGERERQRVGLDLAGG